MSIILNKYDCIPLTQSGEKKAADIPGRLKNPHASFNQPPPGLAPFCITTSQRPPGKTSRNKPLNTTGTPPACRIHSQKPVSPATKPFIPLGHRTRITPHDTASQYDLPRKTQFNRPSTHSPTRPAHPPRRNTSLPGTPRHQTPRFSPTPCSIYPFPTL